MNNTGNGKNIKRSSENHKTGFQTTSDGLWVSNTVCLRFQQVGFSNPKLTLTPAAG
ncbi:hypothetical protein HMPREF3156_00610 [Neisseria sp. HMSC06F02]|nr:hypothetical protein HMPREF3156_00610 [Neisseria sp. HMSC06F02]